MKISLAVFALVLCQLHQIQAAEETCKSIGCTGPFKLCTQENGKPRCLLLGPGPVLTCETRKCKDDEVCVDVGQCVKATCQNIGCTGPFKLCTQKDGKPHCQSLGHGPVVTCATKKCPPGEKCVGVGECVKEAESEDKTRRRQRCGRVRCRRDERCVRGKCESIYVDPVGPSEQPTEIFGRGKQPKCGKARCEDNERCIDGKCEVIFVNPVRPTEPPATEKAGKGPLCGKMRCKGKEQCVKGKCEVVFVDPIRPPTYN